MTRLSLRAAAVALLLAFCALAAGACGNDEEDRAAAARKVLDQTFGAGGEKIDSGTLKARFGLEPQGLMALGGPLTLELEGPFAAPRSGELPRFELDVDAAIANQKFEAVAISTGRKAFLELDGRAYEIDGKFVADTSEALSAAAAASKGGGLKALGIDPQSWIRNPRQKGANERVGEVATIRVGGDLDVVALLEDVGRLLTELGGRTGSAPAGGFLTPKLRKQIAEAVDSAEVDIWTGADDKLLRQIAVTVKFVFKGSAPSPIPGLEAGTINLAIQLTGVNDEPARIAAPKRTRPFTQLTGGRGFGAFLGGIVTGITNGVSVGGPNSGFLRCLTAAGGRSAELVRCAAKLAD